ncbi:LOW QUALITY PROTEIN: hypothetical protein V2J09_011396 [Rumex salicifolius]
MDAFVDAPSSNVVEAAKELAEAQTSVTYAKESDDVATEAEELVEAQTSITDVKESDDAATRAEGVKDGKTPEVIVLTESREIDVGKEDTKTCPNQVKLEAQHADVVNDMKNEKKGVVEESKSSDSISKKLPLSKTDSKRTVSDQATSTKKSRCRGDFTPPSFDLGIDAAFDYVVVVEKEVVISTTDKETSCESVQQIVQETKASKTKEDSKKEDFITLAVNKHLPKIVTVFDNKEEESVRKEWFVSAIGDEMSHTPCMKPNNIDLYMFPCFNYDHYYVIAFNVKSMRFDIIDNSPDGDEGEYEHIPMELDAAKEAIAGKEEVVKEKDEAPKDKKRGREKGGETIELFQNMVHLMFQLHTHGRIICQRGDRRLASIHRFELSPFGSSRNIDMGDVSDELGTLDPGWLTENLYSLDRQQPCRGHVFYFAKYDGEPRQLKRVETFEETKSIVDMGKEGPVPVIALHSSEKLECTPNSSWSALPRENVQAVRSV